MHHYEEAPVMDDMVIIGFGAVLILAGTILIKSVRQYRSSRRAHRQSESHLLFWDRVRARRKHYALRREVEQLKRRVVDGDIRKQAERGPQ
jgi:hypothetical protein